jgi:putative membrane protein
MTTTQSNLASLSRFVVRAPSWYSSVAFALVLAAVTGVAAFDSRFLLEDAWEGIFYVGFPTVVASVATQWVDRRFGGHLSRDGSSLLALTCELAVIAALTVAAVVSWVTPLGQAFVVDSLLVALAAIFALRLLVVMAVSRQPLPVASVAASIQTVVAALLLFVYSGTMRYLEFGGGPVARAFLYRPAEAPASIRQLQYIDPGKFAMLAMLCVLYAGAVWLFLLVVDQPWKRAMGVSVLDFVRGFVGHIAEGTRELEAFFEDIGEEAVVPVSVLSIRRPGGGEKARFVLPMLHPGPMGDIGGGNLPKRIAEEADGLAFPPHATAGHDFNLVTRREVETVVDTAETAYRHVEYDDAATPSVRIEEGEATLTGQAVGDSALLVNTFAPACADDVEYAVGLSAAAEARTAGLEDVLLVDAHNCNDGLDGEDLGHVVPGSRRSFDMIDGAGRVGELLDRADRGPLRVGVAWDETDWDPEDGIGPLGVRVAVFEVFDADDSGSRVPQSDGVDGQQTAYVLVDGNNMEPGVRETLLEGVEGVDRVEVMTTDTHVVNTVEAENQVGDAIEVGELVAAVQGVVDDAIDDLEPVEVGMATETAEVTVFGNDRTEMLASTANAAISMGAPLAAAIILASLAVSALLFILAGF